MKVTSQATGRRGRRWPWRRTSGWRGCGTPARCQGQTMLKNGQSTVKTRSRQCQNMVKTWPNYGQNMVKSWSHDDHGHRESERGRETPARCGQGWATRPRQGSEIGPAKASVWPFDQYLTKGHAHAKGRRSARPLALTSVWPFDQYLTKGHAHARVGDWPGRSPRHDGG